MTKLIFKRLYRAIFSNVAKKKRGRQGKIGLTLLYLNSRMNISQLCLIFGTVPTSVSEVINYMLPLIIKKLRHIEASRMKFPTPDQMPALAALVQNCEPLVDNVIGFVNGLSVPVECSADATEQDKYYNGYHHETCVNNIFAFSSEGTSRHLCDYCVIRVYVMFE